MAHNVTARARSVSEGVADYLLSQQVGASEGCMAGGWAGGGECERARVLVWCADAGDDEADGVNG